VVPKKIICLSLLLVILTTAGCGGFGYHRVQPGDTLYSISWRYGLDYHDLARWNGLKPPYPVRNGQQLRIVPPGHTRETTVAKRSPPEAPIVSMPSRSRAPRDSAMPSNIKWRWPVQGSLLQTFSETDFNRKGIDIGGKLGEPVRAAAAGEVVYAGSGLLNYGKLIILKHDDNYLSAYAYNQALHVREGDSVAAGQQIADMGGKASGDAVLHFEIRYGGRPINPLKFLPQ
jgi:lipoprotein NlpD